MERLTTILHKYTSKVEICCGWIPTRINSGNNLIAYRYRYLMVMNYVISGKAKSSLEISLGQKPST
jgi:hypothetical protein